MKLISDIQALRAQLKALPKEERFPYFWEYYKWQTIIAIVLVLALISGIFTVANHKTTVFTGFVLNASAVQHDEDFLQGFYEYAGIDADNQQAAIYTDMYLYKEHKQTDTEVFLRIMAGIQNGDADFILGKPDAFQRCAYHSSGQFFKNLEEFLDPETFKTLQDSNRLYYVDGAILELLHAPVGEDVDLSKIVYPSPTKPENMEKPIAIGIIVTEQEALRSAYYPAGTTMYLGVITGTKRPELTKQFIDYILS